MSLANPNMRKFLSAAIFLASCLCAVASADMVIELRDGSRLEIPVEAQDIRSIHFAAAATTADDRTGGTAGPAAAANLIRVGPGRRYPTPSAAAEEAPNGALIEIEAAEYPGDVAVWTQSDLTLRGVNGRPHLKAQGRSAQDKAIWVIKGDRVTVENIEFSGAQVRDLNGAGIRAEGADLTIRNCHFHHNQMGLLTGNHPTSQILIEGSEFNDNNVNYRRYGKLGHNLYIGWVKKFTLRNSYVHDAAIGHNVKSRAQETHILYNRISDEINGSSYLIDIAEGGDAYVIGNLLRQGRNNDNDTLISYAAEANRNGRDQALIVAHNTLVNDADDGTFVRNHNVSRGILVNNLAVGPGRLISGEGSVSGNLQTDRPGFRNRRGFDYHLTPDSPALDAGVDLVAAGVRVAVDAQYEHPARSTTRPQNGRPDVGAYEYVE